MCERGGGEPDHEEEDRERERARNVAKREMLREMGGPAGRCVLDRLPGGTGEEAPHAAAARPGDPELERGERRGEKRDTGDAAHRGMRIERAREGRDEVQQARYRPDT